MVRSSGSVPSSKYSRSEMIAVQPHYSKVPRALASLFLRDVHSTYSTQSTSHQYGKEEKREEKNRPTAS